MIIASIVISAAAVAVSLVSAYYARQARRASAWTAPIRTERRSGRAAPPNAPEAARTAELPGPPPRPVISWPTGISEELAAVIRHSLAKAIARRDAPH